MEFFVIFNSLDLETVLGLWLWWFKRAGKNDYLCVVNFFLHLRVGEILVNNNTFNKLGVLDSSTSLSDDLDKVKVNIFALEICYMQY